jgi:hypothetical protein
MVLREMIWIGVTGLTIWIGSGWARHPEPALRDSSHRSNGDPDGDRSIPHVASRGCIPTRASCCFCRSHGRSAIRIGPFMRWRRPRQREQDLERELCRIWNCASTTVRHELYPWPNSSIVVQYIPTLGLLSRRWDARRDGLIKRPAAL